MVALPGSHASGAAPQKKRAFGEPNLMMGAVGAAVGGLIGMIVWYGLIVMLNWEFGILAWGIGGLVGFGCRTLGGGYSPKLGLIAAACAVVAILGGEFFGTRSKVDSFFQKMTKNAYEERMEYAKQAVTKTTEAEMRAFIAENESDDDTTLTPEAVTAAQITEFKHEQAELKTFINGKPNKEEFLKELNGHLRSADMQWLIFKNSFSLWTLLWLFLGVGTAWRLGSGEVE
jgi:type IV secretory pathway TrbD component